MSRILSREEVEKLLSIANKTDEYAPGPWFERHESQIWADGKSREVCHVYGGESCGMAFDPPPTTDYLTTFHPEKTKALIASHETLRSENERLRGALERVAAVSSDTSNIDFEAELARQALDGGHKCPHTETYTRANDSVHCCKCHAYLPERYSSQALQPEMKVVDLESPSLAGIRVDLDPVDAPPKDGWDE